MKIDEAKKWSCAFAVAEEAMLGWEETDSEVLFRVQYMIMAAYVEGVKDAKDYPKSPD